MGKSSIEDSPIMQFFDEAMAIDSFSSAWELYAASPWWLEVFLIGTFIGMTYIIRLIFMNLFLGE